MRHEGSIGENRHGSLGRLRLRWLHVGPQRYTVLAMEALEPRELLAVNPGQQPAIVNEIPFGVSSVLARAVLPPVIVTPPPNFVDPAHGQIPLPPGPPAPNLALGANARGLPRPLLGGVLGLGTGPGSNGNILLQRATTSANPPNTLLPQQILPPPPPGQALPPPPPTPPPVPATPTINHRLADLENREASDAEHERLARERALVDFGGLTEAGGLPAGQGGTAENNAEAIDRAIVAIYFQTSVPVAPVMTPANATANAKPGSQGTLAHRPGTVR